MSSEAMPTDELAFPVDELGGDNVERFVAVAEDLIDGAKMRGLYKKLGCSNAEAVGFLTILWRWGMKGNANDEGLLLNADKSDIVGMFKGTLVGSGVDIETLVQVLVDEKWIDDEPDGLYIHDWPKHQEYWIQYCRRRDKDTERKRAERARARQAANSPSQQMQMADINLPSTRKTDVSTASHNGFEEAYDAYPKKTGRTDAAKAYKARLNEGYSPQEILDAVNAYAAECRASRREKQYIKNPATFFGPGGWIKEYMGKNEISQQEPTDNEANPFSGEWNEM